MPPMIDNPIGVRSVQEWIGKTPDTKVPSRVRVRVFEKAGGKCQSCTRKINAGDSWDADHIVAIVNGGANKETNLQCLCGWCHEQKTKADVKQKSQVARAKNSHLGLKRRKGRPMPGTKASGIRRRMNGAVELR